MQNLDQHFLIDKELLNDIVRIVYIKPNEIILEIGPGPGNLTELLLKKAKKVIAIELDRIFERPLNSLKDKYKNLEIYFGNALDLINNFKFDKIISNIPYSITEPLFKRLFKLDFKKGVFTIGKNFYTKINDKENKWSFIVNSFYQIKSIKEISRNLFNPPPRTDSVLITLEPKEPNSFEKIIISLELQDDKKLKNALIKIFRDEFKLTNNLAKDKIFNLFMQGNILEKNVNYLSNKQFIFIVEKLKSLF